MQSTPGVQIGKKAFISSFLILLSLVIIAGVLTVIIPAGQYSRIKADGKEQIVYDSFKYTKGEEFPVWHCFTAWIEVLWSDDGAKVITLIVLLLIIGGAFAVLEKARVLEYLIFKVIKKFEDQRYLLLALITFFFMLFGSILGIFEEVIALIPITIYLSFLMGWDTLIGLGSSVLAAGFGFSAAIGNPFTVGLAQELAGLPAFSGTWYRVIIFF